MVRRGCAGPASVFPLGLGRQSIGLFLLVAQLLDEVLAIVPGDAVHGEVLFAREHARILAHERFPLLLRDQGGAEIESLRQGDLVRVLVAVALLLPLRAPHHEAPRRDPDELHADAAADAPGRISLRLRQARRRQQEHRGYTEKRFHGCTPYRNRVNAWAQPRTVKILQVMEAAP